MIISAHNRSQMANQRVGDSGCVKLKLIEHRSMGRNAQKIGGPHKVFIKLFIVSNILFFPVYPHYLLIMSSRIFATAARAAARAAQPRVAVQLARPMSMLTKSVQSSFVKSTVSTPTADS
jgi:hypothetical protein